MMSDGASMEMPRYVSHKKVWALKIKEVRTTSDGSMVLQFEDQSVRRFPNWTRCSTLKMTPQ